MGRRGLPGRWLVLVSGARGDSRRSVDAQTSSRPENWTSRPVVGILAPMIIALAGQKGGSGKTTTAIALASEWLGQGRRVLLVDADPQGSTTTFASVAAEAAVPAPTIVAMGPGLHRPEQLPALAADYEVTIIDCPPRHGEIMRAALMVADLVVLPCGPSAVDAWALGASVDLITEARIVRPNLVAVVLLTKVVARTAIGTAARDVLTSSGLPVLASEMHYRVTYQEAPAAGLGPTKYAPTSPAADEVRAVAAELDNLLTSQGAQHVNAA
jgi:chromosome partitioning protein